MNRKTKLSFESLERRDTPTVSFSMANNDQTLIITGDEQNDSVLIFQDDDHDMLRVMFTDNSNPELMRPFSLQVREYSSTTISRIIVNLGRGNDSLQYQVNDGQVIKNLKSLSYNAGAGDDSFSYTTGRQLFYWLPLDGSSILPGEQPDPCTHFCDFKLQLDMGSGEDTADISIGNIADNVKFVLNARLGTGDDRLYFNRFGALGEESQLLLNVDGDQGDDHLLVNQYAQAAHGSLVSLLLFGGNGNDTLETVMEPGEFGGRLVINASGGNGSDTIIARLEANVMGSGMNPKMVSRITLHGGNGEDHFDVRTFNKLSNLVINGGNGQDTARVDSDAYVFVALEKKIMNV